MVERLAERFDLTFYSLASVDPGYQPKGFRLRAALPRSADREWRGRRWGALIGRFVADHARRPYDVTLSLWGYPVGTAAVAISALARRPSAVMLLGAETASVPQIDYGQMRRSLSRRLVLLTCARADALIAVSQQQLGALAQHGLHRRESHLIPIGAEKELFPFEPKTPDGTLKILHVANLTLVKDQATLVRAFALVSKELDARLRIVGSDFLEGAIHNLVRDLGLADRVELVGPVPFGSMPAHYRWSDIAMLTSLSEGQSRFLTEAAMSGVLVVSTPAGHISELGEAAAVVINPGEPQDAAKKIVAAARDRTGWEARVANARAWASAHDMAWTVERVTDVLQRLARQGPPR
jgi:glycosyltransferase involved in cell wall biosynthesis